MHQDLVDKLSAFAREYNLLFTCDFDEKLRIYRFGFQNKEQTWAFCREFTEEKLDTFAESTVYFADGIIDTVKQKMGRLR